MRLGEDHFLPCEWVDWLFKKPVGELAGLDGDELILTFGFCWDIPVVGSVIHYFGDNKISCFRTLDARLGLELRDQESRWAVC